MASKNPFIQELKDLGVTNEQLEQLKELQKRYEDSDAYSKISKANSNLLGEPIRPMTLSYETAYRLMEYNVYGSIQQIIEQYENALILIDEGTTQEYESYISKLAEELQEIGVINAIHSKLKSSDLKKIEFYYAIYKKYEAGNNQGGMSYARQKINELIEA